MSWMIEININDFFVIATTVHDPDTGGEIDADSAPTYDIYENVTDAAVASGTLDKLDDAGTLGVYAKRVQALIATYTVGNVYTVIVGATVGGIPGNRVFSFIVRDTIANRVWQALTSSLTTAGSIGKLIVDNLNATVSSRSTWSQLTAALTTVGSIGKLLVDNIDAAISSRATAADILLASAEGVLQANVPVADGSTQRIPRGDVATLTINAPSTDLSGGKRLFFMMKLDKFDELGDASAKVDREATITQANPLIGTFTFTAVESDTPGKYDAEFYSTDADGVSNPLTLTKDFNVIVFQDVAQ